MNLTISIKGAGGEIKATAKGLDYVSLVYNSPYEDGDIITMETDKAGYISARLEDTLPPAFGFLDGTFVLKVPFGEKRISYSPKSFTGNTHLLTARSAYDFEVSSYGNLAENPLDSHDNEHFFPHAHANVETRGESVFAARNAIDGNITSDNHGGWPYESWGINRNPDAELTLDFGREVLIDKIALTLRADFPHDNWWKEVTVSFSDGSTEILKPQKHGLPQFFDITPRSITDLKLCRLIKDENDPSPFPALIQIACYGRNI